MMGEETMQFEGKTVDHAIELACQHFDCSKEELEITIITKGSTGLFGLGGKKAKIEATFKGGADGGQEEPAVQAETAPPVEVTENEPEEEREEQGREDEEEAARRYGPPAEEEQDGGEDVSQGAEEPIPEEFLVQAREYLQGLFQRAGFEASIEMDPEDPQFPIRISGPDASLIIGREGQTLDVLEYVVNRAVHKMNDNSGPQIHLDAGGYRIKRMENLRHTALRQAKRARSTGRQMALPPMSARDRRIIHLTLKEFHGVTTRSVGEGAKKKVIIVPKRRRGRGGGRPRHHG